MGEVLYSAFCQGDQTIRRGKIFLFLKFCISRSLTRISSKNDVINLKSYFALLKSNTGETLQ